MLGFESLFPCQRKRPPSRWSFFFPLAGGDSNPNMCEEESAFAKGEFSRLCIPPQAVSCHARRSYPPCVQAERSPQSTPRAANSVYPICSPVAKRKILVTDEYPYFQTIIRWSVFLFLGSGIEDSNPSAEGAGFAYPDRRSKSLLFRRRAWVSSPKVNTPIP